MIFFIHNDIGNELINFIIDKYPNDIDIIFYKKKNLALKKRLEKKIPLSNYILWKDKDEKINIDRIKSKNSKLIFLLWWPRIISKKLIDSVSYGCINIHPSYLPYFKGKDPNFWSIISGGPFGVSIHYVNEKIDNGPIIFREKIRNFKYENNAEDLYVLNKKKLIELFKKKYKILRNTNRKISTIKNPSTKVNYRSDMLRKTRISLKKSYTAQNLLNLLRAKTFKGFRGITFKKNKSTYEAKVYIKKI